MEYETEDGVLGVMQFPEITKVRIVIDDGNVRLYVGARDWQWDRHTGEFVGCGTCLLDGTAPA